MRTFTITDKEESELEEWKEEHKKTCEWRYKRRFLTYSFTPTGLGSIITVKCRCGEEKDITDSECW